MVKLKKKKIIVITIASVIILGIGLFAFILTKDLFFKDNNAPITKTDEQILEEKGIKLVSRENFLTEANNLLSKGYTSLEINNIYEYMSEKNIEEILKSDYVDLKDFFQISNFDFTKLDRYLAYKAIENIDIKDVVTRVNLNLDEPFYQTILEIDDPSSITALVNKSHALPSDYVPDDLVSIPSFPNLQIRDDAVDDLENLIAAAKLDNVYLIPYSTYRSYDYQERLYNGYLEDDPKEVVDTYSARPGHSEHQTGLALDIRSSSHWSNLTDSDYEWMLNNSYKYGFIVRYPKDNSSITGYKEEPWHIRYIGIEHATKVHELNITFDEYYDLYLKEY